MKEQIRQYFEQFIKLTDQEWEDFADQLHLHQVSKKTMLLEEGKKGDFIAFIAEGTFRFYHVKEGEEKVTAFFFQGDFVANYRSFLTGQPSDHYIEAMTDSVVYKIDKKNLHRLYDRYHTMERLGRLIAEKLYLNVTQRLDSFLYSTPEDRYNELIGRNSKLLAEVPQYMLASYLGVKPETLSRIRARK